MSVSTKNGWGIHTALQTVSSVVGGVNVVTGNVGCAIVVQAGGGPIRLTSLGWRVDLAPDVAFGTAAGPVRWRVCVFTTAQIPTDVTALQAQGYANGNAPGIPLAPGDLSSVPMLHDLWLDFSAGDPGLNVMAQQTFPDAGPSADQTSSLIILLTPILDANLAQAPIAACNAQMTLSCFGTGVTVAPNGGVIGSGPQSGRSLPRFDVVG